MFNKLSIQLNIYVNLPVNIHVYTYSSWYPRFEDGRGDDIPMERQEPGSAGQ